MNKAKNGSLVLPDMITTLYLQDYTVIIAKNRYAHVVPLATP